MGGRETMMPLYMSDEEKQKAIYDLLKEVLASLAKDDVHLSIKGISIQMGFFKVRFKDESLKDFIWNYDRKDTFDLCFSESLVGFGYGAMDPFILSDPVQRPLLVDQFRQAIKQHYNEWYEKIMISEGMEVNPLRALHKATDILYERKGINTNIHSLSKRPSTLWSTYTNGAPPFNGEDCDYTLKLSTKLTHGGIADVDLLVRANTLTWQKHSIDRLANIPDTICGEERVMLRLAFILYKVWRFAAHRETDPRMHGQLGILDIQITY